MSGSVPVGVARKLFSRARSLVYRSYFALAHANYQRRLIAPRKRTPGGSIRSYELYNRHGRHEMLAELVDATPSAATVYDIGASVGVYALALVTDDPSRTVVAFEPAPGTGDRLRANVALNGYEDRIDVRECGAGDRTGPAQFYVSTYPELSGFDCESATRWEADVATVRQVAMVRLDDLDDLPPPDVVKLDVEGNAPAVLDGARETLSRTRPVLFVEVHEDGLSGEPAREVRRRLTALEYEIYERADYWRCEPQ